MTSVDLFIVRHGESTGNAEERFTGWSDVPLSPKGQLQAQATGKALRAKAPFDAVYTSDLLRAKQTANAIVEEIQFPESRMIVRTELRERGAGIFTGLTFEEASKKYPEYWERLLSRDWFFSLPEGESHQTVSERIAHVLHEIATTQTRKRVIIVSHGVAISHMLQQMLQIPIVTFPQKITFFTENTGIHRVTYRAAGGTVVLSLNSTAHLDGLE